LISLERQEKKIEGLISRKVQIHEIGNVAYSQVDATGALRSI